MFDKPLTKTSGTSTLDTTTTTTRGGIHTMKTFQKLLTATVCSSILISGSFLMAYAEDDETMVLIPRGEFVMGSPETELERKDDETPHHVRITTPYYLGKYEFSQKEWIVGKMQEGRFAARSSRVSLFPNCGSLFA